MKISIITVVFNAKSTVAEAIESVAGQTHVDVEHIIVDGGSNDGTLDVIKRYQDNLSKLISEPDQGIYDAMNKGIKIATGDVIGFLNADDVYQDSSVLSQVVETLENQDLDVCYADLVYVRQDNLDKVVRRWQSRDFVEGLSFRGWMPAHPTLFIRREVYQQVGFFDTQLKFQSDLEFCTRLFEVHKVRSRYVPALWVRMRLGGATNNSIINMIKGNWESYLALRKLGLRRNPISYFSIKFASRLKQFL